MKLPESPYYSKRKHRSYRDRFTAVWLCGTTCNFRCAYCYPCQGKLIDFKVDDFIGGLKKLPQPLRVLITGGEPLLFDWMPKLCQKIGAMGGVIEMQTNLSVNVRKFVDAVDPSYLIMFETSFHPEQRRIKIENGVQKYIDDFKYIQSKGFNISGWLIDYGKYTPNEFLADCKILYDQGITPLLKRYCGDEYGGGSGDTIWAQGKRCLAGYRSVNIWEDFSVTACDTDRTSLGNILTTDIKLYNKIEACKVGFCGCLGRELLVDKLYDEFYQKEFGGEYESN